MRIYIYIRFCHGAAAPSREAAAGAPESDHLRCLPAERWTTTATTTTTTNNNNNNVTNDSDNSNHINININMNDDNNNDNSNHMIDNSTNTDNTPYTTWWRARSVHCRTRACRDLPTQAHYAASRRLSVSLVCDCGYMHIYMYIYTQAHYVVHISTRTLTKQTRALATSYECAQKKAATHASPGGPWICNIICVCWC